MSTKLPPKPELPQLSMQTIGDYLTAVTQGVYSGSISIDQGRVLLSAAAIMAGLPVATEAPRVP